MIKRLLAPLMRDERGLSLGSTPPRPTRTTPAISWPSPFYGGPPRSSGAGGRFPLQDHAPSPQLLRLSEAILALDAYGLSPRAIARLTQAVEEKVRAWRTRPLDEEHYAVFLDGTFLSIRRGGSAKEPVDLALGLKPDGRREILGFWPFGAEGESARNWEEVRRELRRRGVNRVRVFVTDDLPGLEEAIRKIFPDADWELLVLPAVREALNGARKKDREALA